MANEEHEDELIFFSIISLSLSLSAATSLVYILFFSLSLSLSPFQNKYTITVYRISFSERARAPLSLFSRA